MDEFSASGILMLLNALRHTAYQFWTVAAEERLFFFYLEFE
jgi:hypothetical protein